MLGTIKVRVKRHAVFGKFRPFQRWSRFPRRLLIELVTQTKHLESPAVGQHGVRVLHKLMQPTQLRYQLVSWTQIEMIRIGQYHLGPNGFQISTIQGFHRGQGAHGHKHWRQRRTVSRAHLPCPGVLVLIRQVIGKNGIIRRHMQLSDFDYTLPPERVAQTPVEPRDHSRLLHLDRASGRVAHRHFYDLPELLHTGDVLVINDTKVLPVRLFGEKPTGGKVEVLLTKKLAGAGAQETWEALTKPGLKPGQVVQIHNEQAQLFITCQTIDDYTRTVAVTAPQGDVLNALYHLGEMPTPPYIKQFVGDPERYQTIFATHPGSAAAPTAGLHFTPELLQQLEDKEVTLVRITLDVGLGTFLHVTTEDITKHHMHAERFTITSEAAETINQALACDRRVVAVGTTSLRSLESAAVEHKSYPNGWAVRPQTTETELFVYPPYQFNIADALITNFHLPKSTLLMLISAFTSAPQTNTEFTTFKKSWLGQAYQTAITQQYRFFSFGDAMLIE